MRIAPYRSPAIVWSVRIALPPLRPPPQFVIFRRRQPSPTLKLNRQEFGLTIRPPLGTVGARETTIRIRIERVQMVGYLPHLRGISPTVAGDWACPSSPPPPWLMLSDMR
jgi:hypothetical protein